MNEEWKRCRNEHYEVSSLGRVRRATARAGTVAGKVLRPGVGKRGYPIVVLYDGNRGKTSTNVHELVAAAFIGPRPDGMWINHIDGNKINNCAGNLEYVTPAGNMDHASRTGLLKKGDERPNNSKLTEVQVREIRTLRKAGLSLNQVASRYGVNPVTIHDAATGRTWRHVS